MLMLERYMNDFNKIWIMEEKSIYLFHLFDYENENTIHQDWDTYLFIVIGGLLL